MNLFSTGSDYARYLKALGIQVRFQHHIWPQDNATVERSSLQARPWKQELNRLLLQYRTNPLCTTVTRISPLELLFNRVVKETIRVINKKKVRHSEARHNEIKRKEHNR